MMRKLFLLATVLFWAVVLGLWLLARSGPMSEPPLPLAEKTYALAEVARHGAENDCWMAIDGQVYDLTGYLPEHPSKPSIILPWCGREASDAYRTKTKGRAHSPAADQLLPAYRIGRLLAE